ncbi:MAG: tyrosine-type recombinase/integrase, partial [Candidatus Xenobia bacterium]
MPSQPVSVEMHAAGLSTNSRSPLSRCPAPPAGLSPHDFRTPSLPTPVVERPTTWIETARNRQETLDRLRALEAGSTPTELTRWTRMVGLLLNRLATSPGATWQQRWLASGADTAGGGWAEQVFGSAQAGSGSRGELTGAVARLILLGAIRPSYHWLYQHPSGRMLERFRQLHDADGFATLDPLWRHVERAMRSDRTLAYHQLTRILIHNGGRLSDITVEDAVEAYRAQIGHGARLHSYWYLLLHQAGFLPPNSPPTIWAASRRGQLTVPELVDGYQVASQPVRDLFIDYLYERQAGMDYTSLRQLATKLVLLFWRDLELHEPGISSFHLPDAVARRWKQRLAHVQYGNHRVGELREDPYSILMAVRAFYADLAHWTLEDPARWGRWAAPNQVSGRDLGGLQKQRQHSTARMHQRIRELAPVLPTLVATAEERRRHAARLLAAAIAAKPGGEFEIDGERLRRTTVLKVRAARPGVVYAVPSELRARRNLTLEEDKAFWAWAIIEVLRHTGVRIEEMLELTHRSFVAYRLPSTGEVVPMLQITPSKTDRERLLLVSPELAEVLAEIISRVRGGREALPLVSRYDPAERLHSVPLPFLFQNHWGLAPHAFSSKYVQDLLDAPLAASGLAGADGRPLHLTPHDFRRIFATEAVASGLPVHIAAKILGHETLATTQRYVAIYDEGVINHHRAWIARRRGLRPSEEYREPTDAEWEEFLGHFELRKVELGICGRAYGTPCQHEHACVRCPMLRPDPHQMPRLTEIRDNLHARLAESRQQGWLGEVDGLEASIAAAEQKLAAMR